MDNCAVEPEIIRDVMPENFKYAFPKGFGFESSGTLDWPVFTQHIN